MDLNNIWEYSLNFKIQQKKVEWFEFVNFVLENTKLTNVLEIGCYDGGTTIFLSHLTEKLITIDQPYPARFDTYRYHIGNENLYGSDLLNTITNFNYISGNSHDINTYNNVLNLLSACEKFDLLFIDGDHSYGGVKQDYETYSPLVKDGGIIVFHDIHRSSFHESHGCFVHDFWDEIKTKYTTHKTFYYGGDDNHVWGGIGVLIK